MVALRSKRLESLFGVRLEDLAAEHIESLVTNGVEEEFDLDFKGQLYGNKDAERRDLAGDTAALANTAGGVIILGVEEDAQAVAIAAPGVGLSDDEKRRMTQIVASLVAPVPTFDIIPVRKDDNGDAGYYVIAVPRSPAAPHAVLVNQGLRYPKRNGSTTRYLSEPEVAAAYHDRQQEADAQIRRVEHVESEARGRLDLDDGGWLTVALVPDLRGNLELTHKLYRDFQSQVVGTPTQDIFGHDTFARSSVGRLRLLADGTHTGGKARWCSAEYHLDGSGAYSLAQPNLRQDGLGGASNPSVQLFDDESLVLAILTGLRRLASHARDRAAAGGNALVRAQLVVRRETKQVAIGHRRRFRDARGRTVEPGELHPAESIASIDELATLGPQLVAAAATLGDQLAQIFGVAELGQLTRQGEVRAPYWVRQHQPLIREWADTHGIAVSDQTLDSE